MRKLSGVVVLTALAIGAGYIAIVHATPAALFSGTTLALGRFGDIDVANQLITKGGPGARNNLWLSFQKTKGPSDVYVQSNIWQPGGTTGWHTHPGHSLIIVTAGALTIYEGEDASCTPNVYTQGMGFVDPGGDHTHVIRNEGTVEARTITIQTIPAGATRRVDADAPAGCPL